jgi:hypothetical protein
MSIPRNGLITERCYICGAVVVEVLEHQGYATIAPIRHGSWLTLRAARVKIFETGCSGTR